jgi:hypothetical protein
MDLEATYYIKNKAIKSVLLKRPDWLKKGELDDVWKTFKHLNNALLLLITKQYISKRSIDSIISLFKINKERLCNNDDEMELLFTLYYVDIIEYLENICLEDELYEALSNLKAFRKKLARI